MRVAARLAVPAPVGPPVRVSLGPAEVADAARALLLGAVDDPGEGPSDLRVATAQGEYELVVPRGVWTARNLPDLLVRLELSVAEELVRRSGLVALHAGGVVVDGGAVLIAGPSGAGKSTLTAALALRGRPVLGDDAVLMAADGTVHALRRRLKVEEPARTLLALPEPVGPLASLWPGIAHYEPADLGTTWAAAASPSAVVLPERTVGTAHLAPVAPSEALEEVLAQVLLADRITDEGFGAVAAALAEARCWRLAYDAPSAAVDVLLEALA